MTLHETQMKWLQWYIIKVKDSLADNEVKDTYRAKYLKWNEYHKVMQMYYRNKFPNRDYFLDWNRGAISPKDIKEDKLFNYNDLYYLTQMNKWLR